MRHIVEETESGSPRWDHTLCGLMGRYATGVDRITLAGANESTPAGAKEFCPECNEVRAQRVMDRRLAQFKAAEAAEAGESDEARELRLACEAAAHTFSELANDDEVLSVLKTLDGGEDLVGEIRSVALRWTEASQAFLESLRKVTA